MTLREQAVDIIRKEDNSLWAKFMAEERWSELETMYPVPNISNDPTAPEPADLAVIIVGGGSDLSGGRYPVGSAGHALYAVLDGSGWSIGIVDVPGIHDIEAEKVSRFALIKEIQSKWGGYILWDSVNKIVHFRSNDTWQNCTGFQVRYRKNLKHITRTQSNRLITKLYCFGHDDLDIASVNGGVKYITNNSYSPREFTAIYKNQNIYDAQELKEKGELHLLLNSCPRHNYKVAMVDLRTLPEYEHEDFSVGDIVDVIDDVVAPESPKLRILQHKYNIFQPWVCELEIGDPLERIGEQLKASFDATKLVEDVFDSSGYMSGYNLSNFSITQKHLADASVTTRAIANQAIDVDKLADLAVEASKLADSSVEATKIANAAVGSAAIAQAAIGSAHIAEAAILTAHIGDAQIINAHIGNVSANKITAGVIDAIISIYGPKITGGEMTVGTNYKIKIHENGLNGELDFYNNSDVLQGVLAFSDNGVLLNSETQIVIEANDNITLNSQSGKAEYFDGSNDNEIATRGWISANYANNSHTHSNYVTYVDLGYALQGYAAEYWVTQEINSAVSGLASESFVDNQISTVLMGMQTMVMNVMDQHITEYHS